MVLPWLHYEELCNLCWSSKGTPEVCIALVLSIAVAFRIVGGSDISCLDFGQKMRGMNCRCSEVISRATGMLQACVSRLQALRCLQLGQAFRIAAKGPPQHLDVKATPLPRLITYQRCVMLLIFPIKVADALLLGSQPSLPGVAPTSV